MCIFCDIIEKKIPAKVIYENAKVVAFEDLNPVAPVHVLVLPKKHFANIKELAHETEGGAYMLDILAAIPEITAQLDIAEKGFRVINNCGEEGGQTVEHVHFHIIGGKVLENKFG